MGRFVSVLTILVFALFAFSSYGAIEGTTASVNVEGEAEPSPTLLTVDDFRKKSIKELKQFLAKKGLECKGCTERNEFVKMAFENQENPDIAPSQSTEPDNSKKETSPEDLEEIMRRLQEQSGAQFFRPGEFDGLTAEQISAKIKAKNNKKKFKGKPKTENPEDGKPSEEGKSQDDTPDGEKDGKKSKKANKKSSGKGKSSEKSEKSEKAKKKTDKKADKKTEEKSKPKEKSKKSKKSENKQRKSQEDFTARSESRPQESEINFDDAETIEL